MSTELQKSQINLDCPDERDVIRLVFQGVSSVVPRGFLDVFTAAEVLRMWSSDNIQDWSRANRDWLTLTADTLL